MDGLKIFGMKPLATATRPRFTSDQLAPADTLGVNSQLAMVASPPRLLDNLRRAIRSRHYSIRTEDTVFSNPGMSLERPEIDDAKRVDPL